MGSEPRLSEFNFAGEFDARGTLMMCFDHQRLVLAVIEREALGDYFEGSFTASECALLVERNSPAFESIIEAKYSANDFLYHEMNGFKSPLVSVSLSDMQRSGLKFSASVIEMSRNAGFIKP